MKEVSELKHRIILVEQFDIPTATTTSPTIQPQSVVGKLIQAPHGYKVTSAGWSWPTPAPGRVINSYPFSEDGDTQATNWLFEIETFEDNAYVQLFVVCDRHDDPVPFISS